MNVLDRFGSIVEAIASAAGSTAVDVSNVLGFAAQLYDSYLWNEISSGHWRYSKSDGSITVNKWVIVDGSVGYIADCITDPGGVSSYQLIELAEGTEIDGAFSPISGWSQVYSEPLGGSPADEATGWAVVEAFKTAREAV